MGEAASASLDAFSAPVREWFLDAYGAPTAVQERTWRLAAAGENVLAIAPTGSGKTFAAFLQAIDELAFRDAGDAGDSGDAGVKLVYVSPLKALAADIERNLRGPLAAIAEMAAARGDVLREIAIGMRTGDTAPRERRAQAAHPPDILITTPESLYLMLTSKARETLRSVRTVIVDELHSLEGTKRGAHLSLSLERLDGLLAHPAQRIGLSATVRPADEAARFLGGVHPVAIVDEGGAPDIDVRVVAPVPDMTSIPALSARPAHGRRKAPAAREAWKTDRALAAHMAQAGSGDAGSPAAPDSRIGSSSIWPFIENAVLDEVLAHRTTIVFVNSRGLCERFAARLNERYADRMRDGAAEGASAAFRPAAESAGTDDASASRSGMGPTTGLAEGAEYVIAKAHHGSVAKERRRIIEDELKRGAIPCVVATSSLELGIDMGEVDLVMQIAPPPSVASGLQRIGRADHRVGRASHGIVFPRMRTDLIDCAVVAEGMYAGRIEETRPLAWPLDVLAQQTVAQAAMEGVDADAWYGAVRRSACYRDLPRDAFDRVIGMLAGRYSGADGAGFPPRIGFDRETGMMSALSGTQRLAVGGAGTIPDRGLYPVVLPEKDATRGRRRVGELDEEMVHESRAGDVISLGNGTWRIKRITNDRVVVEPARGRSSRLPFWHGERTSRGFAEGERKARFLRACESGVASPARGAADGDGRPSIDASLDARLDRAGLDVDAKANLAAFIACQRARTGGLPTDARLVLEKTRMESGDACLILHSVFGRRVNEPWALIAAERFEARFGYAPQATAFDDGIVIAADEGDVDIVDRDLFAFDPASVAAQAADALPRTSLFAARFRECAVRALLMHPQSNGRRMPLWLQRVKGAQLLESARRFRDFPMIVEAMRECMQDVYDLAALKTVMERLAAGTLHLIEARTDAPSPFAAPLVFGNVAEHLYDADMPAAERRASLLSVDPSLLAEILGPVDVRELVDERAERDLERDRQHLSPARRVRGADGALALLRAVGPLSAREVARRMEDGDEAGHALAELFERRRAFPFACAGERRWAAAEDARVLRDGLGADVADWALWEDDAACAETARSGADALRALVARFARTHGSFGTDAVCAAFGVAPYVAQDALERLARDGVLVRDDFGADVAGVARIWMDAEVLARVKALSLSRARDEARPVAASAYVRFLFDLQGVSGGGAYAGVEGTAEVIAQFEGMFFEAGLWEAVIFPARVGDYAPQMLDELLRTGEVVWIGRQAASRSGAPRFEVAFFPTDSPLAPLRAEMGPDELAGLDAKAARARLAAGELMSDSFVCVREACGDVRLPKGAPRGRRATSRRRGRGWAEASRAAERAAREKSVLAAPLGRLARVAVPEVGEVERAADAVCTVLDVYGVMAPDTASCAGVSGGMWPLARVLDHMEETGELVRGVLVEGLGPAQFARKDALEAMRARAAAQDAQDGVQGVVVLDAADPANVFGVAVPWPEVPRACAEGADADADLKPQRKSGALVAVANGAPVLFCTSDLGRIVAFAEDGRVLDAAVAALSAHLRRRARGLAAPARRRFVAKTFCGRDVADTAFAAILERNGFVRLPDGMHLYVDPF